MSEWKKVKLGDCITTKKGFAFKSALYTSKGVPVVRVSDFTLNSITDKDLVYYPVSEYDKYKDYVLAEKDILIQTVGSWQYNPNSVVGKVVRVPYYHLGSLLNQNIVKIIPIEGVDKNFLYYRIKCIDFSGFVIGEARGAANQASITLDTIKRFTFCLPPSKDQQKIGTILSRYDSLIENYQKQIKLLEEAAQRLYKEWFVDLHFPGHENTKIVDGVPEGWEMKRIGDIVEYFDKQRKPLSSMQRMTMDKFYPYYGAATLMDYVDNYLFDGIYLLLGEDGTVITPDNYPVLQYVWGKFWVNNHAHVLRGKDSISTEFLFAMFKEMPIADVVTGAAQPKISQGRLSEKKVLIPPIQLILKWSDITKAYFDSYRNLSDKIRLLTEARDRLLPKLMSGEIAV